jgi:hypothetical protein
MGSNHSKVLHAIDIAAYDDSNIREYLVYLANNDPESFKIGLIKFGLCKTV